MASGLASSIACATAPASILPSGGACSVTISRVGLLLLDQFLERRRGRLAVFEVRIDQRPALLFRRDRARHQHRRLHVGRGAQAERVFVAVGPGDLVGERLGGEEEHLLLAGEVGHGETDVRQERAGERDHALARHQLFRRADRLARIGAVVARDDLELLAVDAAFGVDLLDRHLPTLLVGVEEGRLRFVAVELADLDGLLRQRRRGKRGGDGRGKREADDVTQWQHDSSPLDGDGRVSSADHPRCGSSLQRLRRLRLGELVCAQIV